MITIEIFERKSGIIIKTRQLDADINTFARYWDRYFKCSPYDWREIPPAAPCRALNKED